MRRGLMGWDEAELPRSALSARLDRLQAAMAREGFDALLLYTNLVRPAAVCWLTGFTPYWIESLLLVPANGRPMLATALSKRVADWIRTTAWLDEIVNTPKPGTAIGERLAGRWRVVLRCAPRLPTRAPGCAGRGALRAIRKALARWRVRRRGWRGAGFLSGCLSNRRSVLRSSCFARRSTCFARAGWRRAARAAIRSKLSIRRDRP